MKKTSLMIGLLACMQIYAQDTTYNQNSIEIHIGSNLATNYYSTGYHPGKIGSFSTNLAFRHMFTNNYGIRFSGTYNHLKNSNSTTYVSLPYTSTLISFTTEGVINLARILNFETFSNKIGLTFHTGIGLSSLKNENSTYFKWFTKNNSDEMIHFVYGLTPNYKLNNRLRVNLDYSYYSFCSQNNTFDLKSTPNESGFVGKLGTLTVGLTINLGKNENHIDDCISDLKVDLKPLEDKLKTLEDQQLDDDQDGVPNYLDIEKDTPENSTVNRKGQRIEPVKSVKDSDNDGITDEFDLCPNEKGLFSNDGCPGNKIVTINNVDSKLQFESNSTQLTPESEKYLAQLIVKLQEGSINQIILKGHADERGSETYNMNLSKKRAEAIKTRLIKAGVKGTLISIISLGETSPIDTSSTPEAYAKNRRVEVILK